MEDPRNIGMSTHLLFGAKNIERAGDHTTNIAETIHFLVRGFNIADDRPKDDRKAPPSSKRKCDSSLRGSYVVGSPDERNMSTGHVEQTDLLSLCFVESADRLRCRLNHDLALLLAK